MRRMSCDDFVKLVMTIDFFGWIHEETLVDSSCHVLSRGGESMKKRSAKIKREEYRTYPEIPRINQQRIFHILAYSHKLTKHARTLIRAFLSYNELHAGCVHPIAQGCDNSQISNTEKSVEFIFFESLMAVFEGTSSAY